MLIMPEFADITGQKIYTGIICSYPHISFTIFINPLNRVTAEAGVVYIVISVVYERFGLRIEYTYPIIFRPNPYHSFIVLSYRKNNIVTYSRRPCIILLKRPELPSLPVKQI